MTSWTTTSRGVSLRTWLLGTALVAVTAASLVVGLRAAGATGSAKYPDLVADPPDHIYFEDVSEEGAPHLLMRFNGYVHNAGTGSLEFRGQRAESAYVKAHRTELEHYTRTMEEKDSKEEETETLPEAEEQELAKPPMEVIQNRFSYVPAKPGEPPTVSEKSEGEMLYVNADGHHHWHLNHVARYSLWNAAKTSEVAPAKKVGFCMEDSQRVENTGPTQAVYSEGTGRHFCQFYAPWTKEVWEGISPGWRDVYSSTLALQWVDVSDVIPGEYWLREDVNPLHFVKEEESGKKYEYAKQLTIVPGYDAVASSPSTPYGKPLAIVLSSKKYRGTYCKEIVHGYCEDEGHFEQRELGAPRYEVVSQPAHGKLTGSGEHWTYTPEPGFSGTDTFQYTAWDPESEFPAAAFRAKATVSIQVGPNPAAHVAITGAPSTIVAGTSVPLQASVEASGAAVEWSASGGAIQGEGARELRATFTAPGTPGNVTVTAHLAGYPPGVSATATISVVAPPVQNPAPSLPEAGGAGGQPSGGVAGETTHSLPLLGRPRAMLVGKLLVMTVVPGRSGRVRLTAYLGSQVLGRCASKTPGGRAFTCHVHLKLNKPHKARIKVVAMLHFAETTKTAVLGPEHVPAMLMAPMRVVHPGLAHTAAYGNLQFWCSPSTLTETLARGGEE